MDRNANNNFKDAYVDISRHINTKDILIKEGVFTPILVGGTTTGSNDYLVQSGYYYKIGKSSCRYWNCYARKRSINVR